MTTNRVCQCVDSSGNLNNNENSALHVFTHMHVYIHAWVQLNEKITGQEIQSEDKKDHSTDLFHLYNTMKHTAAHDKIK